MQYGFGLKIGDKNGKPYFSHAGSGQGGSSVILIYPDEKAVIVLAGNMEDDTMNSVLAVSYTHLDVNKRQVLWYLN